jgi:hypothetical protein
MFFQREKKIFVGCDVILKVAAHYAEDFFSDRSLLTKVRLFLWMFLMFFLISAEEAEPLKEDSVNVVEISRVSSFSTPIMKNDSLIYFLDLIFKEFPAKFWSYSDSSNHVATIEILGSEVRAPAINLPGPCPVNDIQIKNQTTKMALSGQMATITFAIDPGWNVEIAQLDSNDIRLTLGKKMTVREIKDVVVKKNK